MAINIGTGYPNAEQGRAGEEMRKLFAAVLICIVIVAALAAIFLKKPPIKVGMFTYWWYGADSRDWQPPRFMDSPASGLGNYSSLNRTVAEKELLLIEALGVDFIVNSWWGPNYAGDYAIFNDDAIKQAFDVTEENSIDLKLCIMVENYLRNDTSYNLVEIYEYIYSEYVAAYPEIYYKVDDKPLICLFNDPQHVPGLTPNGTFPSDTRFTTILVGDQAYTQWTYNDIRRWNSSSFEPHTNQITVVPRYDERHLMERNSNFSVDSELSEGVYDSMWQKAIQLWEEGKIDTILITSWNEYLERTAIEPHIDATAENPDPWFLFNKTRDYISEVRSIGK